MIHVLKCLIYNEKVPMSFLCNTSTKTNFCFYGEKKTRASNIKVVIRVPLCLGL